MGKRAQEIVELNLKELILQLNKALADEWLAYYQYWIGSKVVKGINSTAVISELTIHATEELNHANLLVNRIIQLGGTPILNPKDWFKLANCEYAEPKNFKVDKILKQNIDGERCAIEVYNKILKFTQNKDVITYDLIKQILSDEIEHEQDLENLLEDLK